jgi:hypothetical protein
MTPIHLLASQRQHLSGLLEAIQRCVYFLHASDTRIPWPLTGVHLETNKKHNDLYATACRFVTYCEIQLSVTPSSADFTAEFIEITAHAPH